MTGISWHEGCPVPISDLRVLDLVHWTDDGTTQPGQIVLHKDHVESARQAFSALFEQRFPITSITPIRAYNGDDDASMAADNTSGFNCRQVPGTSRVSEHAKGMAIDINPLRNPFVRGTSVMPPAGRDWLDRSDIRPGMLTAGDNAVQAFRTAGWRWGGTWRSSKDYQHFSITGR